MSEIKSIFPVPIYRTNVKEIISKEDLDYIKNQKQVSYKNEGNFTSKDTYIFKEKITKKDTSEKKKKLINRIKNL